MFRLRRIRVLAPVLVVLLAVAGVVACVARPEPQTIVRVAPAPIDAAIPRGLRTATFGLG